MKVITEMRRVH